MSGPANKRSADGEMKNHQNQSHQQQPPRAGRQSPTTITPPSGERDTKDAKTPARQQAADGNDGGAAGPRDANTKNGDHPSGGKNGGRKSRAKSSMKNGQSSHREPNGAVEKENPPADEGGGGEDGAKQHGRSMSHGATAVASLATSSANANSSDTSQPHPPLPIRPPAPLSLTSEEINFLLYRYLQECGFVHSSFTFAHESGVGRVRPRNSSSIPPGALVMFLQKGLQYVGMEESLTRELHVQEDSNAASGEEPAAKRPKGAAAAPKDDVKAKAGEGGEPSPHASSLSMGHDFSLLCPRALHTLSRKDPPIKLRVPPASAAAATKARMETEERLTRERAAMGEERRRRRDVAGGEMRNHTLEPRGSNSEGGEAPPPAASASAEELEEVTALPTPKKRKKKKKGSSAKAVSEEVVAPNPPASKEKGKKSNSSNNAMEVEEAKPSSSSSKGGKQAAQQQQQQATLATQSQSSMGQIEATAAAMRAAAAGQMFPGMAAAVSALVQKGGPGGANQQTPRASPGDGAHPQQQQQGHPRQQSQQQGQQHHQHQQQQVQAHQRQQQEYQMEMAAAKRMQDAQRFQEAQQRMQHAQEMGHHPQQHRMHQGMWDGQPGGQGAQPGMPQGPSPGGPNLGVGGRGGVEPRGPPQSYQSQMEGGAAVQGARPHQAEAAEVARQRAEIQAVLAQRQQAVQAMAQQGSGGGGHPQGQSPAVGSQMGSQPPGQHGTQQGAGNVRKGPQGREEGAARANAIAALMQQAAGGGAGQRRTPGAGAEGVPSSSAMGNAPGNVLRPSQNGQQAPVMPGDKRGAHQDARRGNVVVPSPGDSGAPASGARPVVAGGQGQPSAATIEEEDRLTAIRSNEVMELSQHTSEVFMCAWNPRFTNLIATGSGDASARIWAIGGKDASGGCQRSILLPHGHDSTDKKNKDVTTLEWSSSGELLATGSYDGVARVWSRNGELRQTLKGHRGPIFSLKWNKRGNFLLSGSYDKSTIVWDVTGEVGFVKQQFSYHFAPALDVDWKDDLTFASCSTDKTVQICRVGLARPIKTYTGHADEVNAVKWDPSGTLLASCSDDCTAKVWDINSPRNEPKWDFKSHQQEIYTVKWSPTGPGSKNPNKVLLLATASFDGSVRLWNVANGSCLRILSRHRESVYSVAFSPSGEYLASGSLAGQLYIWNVGDGVHIKSFKGKGDIFEVAWNVEETRVAACFSSNVVSVIDFKKT